MLLAENFAIAMCQELGLPFFPGFSDNARQILLDYRWPGNIRELKMWLNVLFIAMAPVSVNWIILLSTLLRAFRLQP